MSETEIRSVITNIFNDKPNLKGIASDQDFFDMGASSLTIVDIQINLEEKIDRKVATAKLMENPTIDGWVAAYAVA